jgi:hypothetical protein
LIRCKNALEYTPPALLLNERAGLLGFPATSC